ncbi:MAG: DNA methyltransferase [Candidatus Omnitrophota bacterium]|jgi:DNA modification methylase|nr:MAG: DNA methyltransferase [Candidatus Omnitrophota bacterium]
MPDNPTFSIRKNRNSGMNKLNPEDSFVHDWYRFVLSFPPHFVREYICQFGLKNNQCVFDPFCGTGTTLVESKKIGIPCVGFEANPMAFFASRVKTDWSPNSSGLLKHANIVAEKAYQILAEAGIEDESISNKHEKNKTTPSLRVLTPEVEKLLLKNSISPLPLHKTLVLLDCLDEYRHKTYHDHERLALAKALVSSIGNLHFGPEVGVGRAKMDVAVIPAWLSEMNRMAESLYVLRPLQKISSNVFCADSRTMDQNIEPNSIDAVITSPPYPNEKDYTRTTRLESVLLGFIKNKDELRALKKQLLRSNTRGVYKDDDDDRWVSQNEEIQRIAEAIEKRRIELGKTSGFERLYHRVTKLYFGGMARHFAELRKVLRPGAQLAYVVGDQASYLQIMIRTGKILAELAQSLGYKLIEIKLFRTRLATATKKQLREEILLLRWPG